MTGSQMELVGSATATGEETSSSWGVAALAGEGPVSRWVVGVTFAAVAVMYALLWSPHYYPLSDSSLYLKIAKGLASGKGLEYVWQTHRSIRPFTPLMLSWVVRAGGGVGAIHALLIVLMLGSFALMFATVARWVNGRVAYWVTLLTALSWWVYANAFTIMTEPPFLVFLWGSLLALSFVRDARPGWRRWALVSLGVALLVGAWENRVAAILFVPGMVVALWLTCRDVAGVRERLGWAAIFGVVFLALVIDYRRPVQRYPGAATQASIQVESAAGALGGLVDVGDVDGGGAVKGETGYRWNVMVGVSHPAIQMPVNGGRWAIETLAAGLVYPFRAASPVVKVLGSVMGLAGLVVLVLGAVWLARSGQWWPVALLTYFLPIWFMWGTRVKPRYMIPVAPAVFILLWAGLAVTIAWVLRWWAAGGREAAYRAGGRWALAAMLLVSVPMNGFAYGVEVYLRRFTPHDFYDQARRGAFAELVDICSYLRKNTPADAEVWLNRGASRRIVGLLSDREVWTVKREVGLTNVNDQRQFAKLLPRIKGKYFIALYEQNKWPAFHLPLAEPAADGAPARWWQLFAYDEGTKTFRPVEVPRGDRTSVREMLRGD